MERRTFLKTTAGIATAATIGTAAFSQTGAAAGVSISATNPAQVSNDRGDVTAVTVNPNFRVEWEGFDDAVGKVFFLIEGKVGEEGEYQPLFRSTPWLPATAGAEDGISASGPGTTGHYEVASPLSFAYNFPQNAPSGIVVADEQGQPDYSSLSFPGGVDLQSFLDGTSMSTSDNYPDYSETHQNNYPSLNSGYYGAAADTSAFDNGDDGSTSSTRVYIRYTFELQRPNFSYLEYHISEMGGGELPTLPEDASEQDIQAHKEALASYFDGLQASDIDAGNSRLVMEGEDGYPSFDQYSDGAGIPYDVLRDNADSHPGIMVEEAAFTVRVRNEKSQSSGTGRTNAGASGSSP